MATGITIGITCYSEGELLRECWDSVLAQTSDSWEAVMVLDKTDDEPTISVFDSISHPKLRKLRNAANLGPYPTRARAIEMADTEYFFCLDADDRIPCNAVADVVRAISETGCDYVCGDWLLFDPPAGYQDVWRGGLPTCESLIDRDMEPCVTCFSIDAWEATGGYASELWGRGDFDFIIGLMEHGARGVYIASVVYEYRQGGENRVSGSYKHRIGDMAAVIVRRHPLAFRGVKRRREFLTRAFAQQAWSCYWARDLPEAARAARAATRLAGFKRVVPLLWADTLPLLATRFLVLLRRAIGRLVHWPIVVWR